MFYVRIRVYNLCLRVQYHFSCETFSKTQLKQKKSYSTGVNVSQSVGIDGVDDLLKKSLLYALYGDDMNELLVRKINVTFGSPDDGFYKKTKYQAW